MARKGAVAAGHRKTAEAAQIVLEEGGNAYDAVLAALCAACVAEPVLASLGGGGFLLAGGAGQAPVLYDFFTQTPCGKRPENEIDLFPILADFGTTQQEFHIGMGAIATPGVVKGIFAVHRDLGSMPLQKIVEPAVKIAKEGVKLNRLQAYILDVVGKIYVSNDICRSYYTRDGTPDTLATEGDVLRFPEFADALEIIAIEGADLFYRGEMAQAMTADSALGGGNLTMDDLAHYSVERRKPLAIDMGRAKVFTNPPPSSGGLLIAFALELLKGAGLGGETFGSARHLDVLAHVMAQTNKARVDSELHEREAEEAAETLLHPGFIEAYRNEVLDGPAVNRGTTHMSVIDAEGNAASLTVSNGEGSAYFVPGTGIMLNNMLGEEDINPHGFNQWPVGKRMCSMMAPSLVFETGGTVTALGSGGSNRIRTAILQALINHLEFGMGLEDAVCCPRIHFEGGVLNVEPGFRPENYENLLATVPEYKLWDDINLFFGGVHAVARGGRGHTFSGVGDPRRGGVALING